MANQSTRQKIKLMRKEGKHFHGTCCCTGHGQVNGRAKTRRAWIGGTSALAKPARRG